MEEEIFFIMVLITAVYSTFLFKTLQMKLTIKWFLTGKTSQFEDTDDIIGPQTTSLEVKGFIQMQFGFPASRILLIHKHLWDNDETLQQIGVTDQQSADRTVITAHVMTDAEHHDLEKPNLLLDGMRTHTSGKEEEQPAAEEEDEEEESCEFTHEEFITAMKLLGRPVPISNARMAAMRDNAPRARPAFLNQKVPQTAAAVAPPSPAAQPARPSREAPSRPRDDSATAFSGPKLLFRPEVGSEAPTRAATQPERLLSPNRLLSPRPEKDVRNVLQNSVFGLRIAGVDKRFAVRYPGVSDPFDFWDLRLPAGRAPLISHGRDELLVEMFFFGSMDVIIGDRFIALVTEMLHQHGFKCHAVGSPRASGCMYPLIAVTVLVHEVEAWELGRTLFENFGTPRKEDGSSSSSNNNHAAAASGKATKDSACSQQ